MRRTNRSGGVFRQQSRWIGGRGIRLAGGAGVLLMLLGSSLPVWASLGGDVASVEADRAHMRASVQVNSTAGYDVHEMQSAAGTVVSEYVSPAGKVFAVAWHGPFPPDMQQLLGSRYQQYTTALQAQERHFGHRPLNIEEPGLVIQTGGHMRAYFGRVYIPEQLPPTVKAEEIR